MTSNIDVYKKDLEKLSVLGNRLHMAMQLDCYPDKIKEQFELQHPDGTQT